MKVRWSRRALADVSRLYEFLATLDPDAAARARGLIRNAPQRLAEMPRIGQRVDAFKDAEVRRIPVGVYELRYEIYGGEFFILRVHHQREDRER